MSSGISIPCSLCGAPGVGSHTLENGAIRTFCSTHINAPDGRTAVRAGQNAMLTAGQTELFIDGSESRASGTDNASKRQELKAQPAG
jgi:hypothetical protein